MHYRHSRIPRPLEWLYSLLLFALFVGAEALAQTGTLSASPTQVVIAEPATVGSTQLSWTTSGTPGILFTVSMNGAAEVTVDGGGPAGSTQVPWISVGSHYLFRLYASPGNSIRGPLLSTVAVTGIRPVAVSGDLNATPTVVTIAEPAHVGTTVLSWTTNSMTGVIYTVRKDGGTEAPVNGGPASGSDSIPWIAVGSTYEFKLYASDGNNNLGALLDTVTVTGVRPLSGSISAGTPIVEVYSGSTGSSALHWNASGASATWITKECGASGRVVLLAQGPLSGNLNATALPSRTTCTFSLYTNASLSNALASATVQLVDAYEVGVFYHSTTANFSIDHFLGQYHQGNVRNTVRQHLQQMANAGASLITTGIWLIRDPGQSHSGEYWKWAFPPEPTELANLRLYAEDVASIVATDGHRLRLNLSYGYDHAAAPCNRSGGCPLVGDVPIPGSLGVPESPGRPAVTSAQYLEKVRQSYEQVADAVAGVRRSDGTLVVETIYFIGELQVDGASPNNMTWLLKSIYPAFHNYLSARQLTPSLYFLPLVEQLAMQGVRNSPAGCSPLQPLRGVLMPWTDFVYPLLNDRVSMYWPYRSVKFMRDNNLPVPERIDFSMYPFPQESHLDTSIYTDMVNKILLDARSTLPQLLLRDPATQRFGVTETVYPYSLSTKDDGLAARRKLVGNAFFRNSTRLGGTLARVSVWTTPYDFNTCGVPLGYTTPLAAPTDFSSYQSLQK